MVHCIKNYMIRTVFYRKYSYIISSFAMLKAKSALIPTY